MRRVIDGKLYDTETALKICPVGASGFTPRDFQYEDTDLYRTKRGNWFLAGEGGPRSRWAEPRGQNGMASGSGIQPLTPDEARSFAERECSADEVAEHFTVEEA